MLCASCGQPTSDPTCEVCGQAALLGGRYRLDEILRESAQSVTYRGTRIEDDLSVAIKELPFRSMASFRPMDRLRREAEILRQLEHPGIPKVLDELQTGQDNRMACWLVQTFVEGEDLERQLQHHRFSAVEVAKILGQLAQILGYLHERQPPVVHRDIKPSNVMVTPAEQLALVDFGAVRDALRRDDEERTTVAGTFGYMAPEQLRGEILPASDVYAAGATALRLVTQKDPSTLTDYSGALKHEVLQSLPPDLGPVIQRLMAIDPTERPADGAAMERVLWAGPAALRMELEPAPPSTMRPGKWRMALSPMSIATLVVFAVAIGLAADVWLSLIMVCGTLSVVSVASVQWNPRYKPAQFRQNLWAAGACLGLAAVVPVTALATFGWFGFLMFGIAPSALLGVLGYHFFTGTPEWMIDGDKDDVA